MQICGLQKLTLLDYPGKLAATLFTGGCNLRCPYCQNAVLVLEPETMLTESEVLDLLQTRRGLLDGIAVTGGEPLLQKELEPFLHRCKTLGFSVKLDTNGCFPERLRRLVEAGLVDYVAMDVKNDLSRYPETVGCPGFDTGPVEESAAFLREGHTDWEFRTTVVREFHAAESLLALAQWLEGSPRYYLQAFVDSGHLMQSGLHGFSVDELHHFVDLVRPYFGTVGLRGVD